MPISEEKIIEIHYNAFSTIKEQLDAQHFKCSDIELYEKAKNNMLYLYIHGFMTDSEKDKVLNKIHKKLLKNIRKKI